MKIFLAATAGGICEGHVELPGPWGTLTACKEIKKRVAEYETLQDLVDDFVTHKLNCHIRDAFANTNTQCSCGLSEALLKLRNIQNK